jgi:hypothetical protein
LQIDKAEIVRAAGNVGIQPQNRVLRRCDTGNLDRAGVLPDNRALERLIRDFARLQLDKRRGKIVSPAAEGLTDVILPCRPFHDCKTQLRSGQRRKRLPSVGQSVKY